MRALRFVWRFAAGPAVGGMIAACSGAFSPDLITSGDGPDSDMDAAPPHPGVDSSEPVVGHDASRGDVGGGQAEGGPLPGTDASTEPDAKAALDAAVPHDAAVPIDAAQPSGIVCGARSSGLLCHGTETCCATSKNNGFTYACITQGSTCGGLPIACAESADCTNNQACCYDTANGANRVTCMALSACKMGQLLCNPDLAAAACPAGYTCQPYNNTVPYYSCK